MKKIILLVVSLCVLFALTACGQPEVTGYHIDENGKLIATYEDNTTADLGTPALAEAIAKVDRPSLVKELEVGEYTLNDILDAFVAPSRDPREEVDAPILRSDVLHLEDLKPGMELQGTVRNVVDFGAFVDCGVKDDGLVHISKMSNGFIKHPLDAVSVGQIVKVWVLEVDLKKNRLQLTMIDPNKPKKEKQPKKAKKQNK